MIENPPNPEAKPLVVDLDGTLIHTDMLHESSLKLLRDRPWDLLRIPSWLHQGKAVLKQHLADRTQFDPISLPYNEELIDWLKQQKAAGRAIILCTASDHSIAESIAAHLGLFDEVVASDGGKNLAGDHKAEVLEKQFGLGGFDYAGNSNADLAVWKSAHRAIVVNATRDLENKARAVCEVEQVFAARSLTPSDWRRVFRVHQWLKNVLLFVPIFAAHQLSSPDIWGTLILAFFSFSLCASTVYITNDLLDLESDRQHPRKRYRPFASGSVPVWIGVLLAPSLFLISLALGWLVGNNFLAWLLLYFALTSAYSWGLKRLILVDSLTLAMLYTLRIVAGAAAVNMSLSFWLLALSVFIFLSLAFVKRYAELEVQLHSGKQKIHGRGYYTSDAPMIQSFGVVSGYTSVLVLALYINSSAVMKLYQAPQILWGTVPIMLFWISWMWMRAHRGEMHDDPLIFAVKDKASLMAGAAFAAVFGFSSIGWPW